MSSAFSQWLTNRNYERIQTHDAPSEDTEKEKKLEQKEQPSRHLKMVLLVSFPSNWNKNPQRLALRRP